MSMPPSETELHAFIDGELSPARHAEIAQIARDDAALAERIATYEAERDRLRAALDPIADEALPAAWLARIEAATTPERRVVPSRGWALAASVAAVLVAGAAVATWEWPAADLLLADAEAARNDRLPGADRLAGDRLPAPTARNALLLSTLGMPVQAPDLGRFGYRLVTLDLFRPSGQGAAQLAYRDAAERVVTIFVRPSNGTVRFDLTERGDTRVCVWQDNVVSVVIMGRMSAGEMMRLASSAYTALNL